jgi:hypothetical protein
MRYEPQITACTSAPQGQWLAASPHRRIAGRARAGCGGRTAGPRLMGRKLFIDRLGKKGLLSVWGNSRDTTPMNPLLSGGFSGGTAQRRKLRASARRPSVPIPRGHPWPAGDALSQDTPLRHKHRARSSHEPTGHKTLLTRLSRALSLAGSTGFRCLRRASAPIACSTRPAAADIAHDATSRQISPQMERSPKSSPCLARSNKRPSGQAAIRGRPSVARR